MLEKTSQLIGMTVRNFQGERLGRLTNIVFDAHQGKVAYGIVSIRRGWLGSNKDLVAVPWPAIDLTSQPGIARLNMDRQTLEAMAFSRKDFPNLADAAYSRQLYERFDVMPYGQTPGYVPAEKMMNEQNGTSSARMEGSKESSMFQPGTVETVRGTVQSVGTFRLQGVSHAGLRLRIKTDEGKMLVVRVGPLSYIEHQNISFHRGDQVTVTGSPVRAGWRHVIVASQITMGDKTVTLRTKEGKPLWNPDEIRTSREVTRPDQVAHSGALSHAYEW